MTTTSADGTHVAGSGREDRSPREQPRTDGPGPVQDPAASSTGEEQLRELLAPFVAWLATQNLDEPQRRRHRVAAERFLRWTHTDAGPVEDRRRRYEKYLQHHDPDHRSDAHAGLGWWAQHRQLLAWTVSTDR